MEAQRKRNALREREDVGEIPNMNLVCSRGGEVITSEGTSRSKSLAMMDAVLTQGTKR